MRIRTRASVLLLFLVVILCLSCSKERTVHLYTWADYIPDAVLDQFTRETGIRVVVAVYDSGEAMYGQIRQSRKGNWDVAVPSSPFVGLMRREGLLEALDRDKLPNLRFIDPRLLHRPFDPDNDYSMPFMWGGHGIVVNTEAIDPDTVLALSDLWRPELEGRLLLPANMRTVMGMALRSLGYSINDRNEEHIRLAFERLVAMGPNIRVFNSERPSYDLTQNIAQAAVVWNGEARTAIRANPRMRFVYPREGAGLWLDSLVIPKGAQNVEGAHALINYLLRPDVAARLCQESGYATANVEARRLLPESVSANPLVYPPDEVVAASEIEDDTAEATAIYARYWSRLPGG